MALSNNAGRSGAQIPGRSSAVATQAASSTQPHEDEEQSFNTLAERLAAFREESGPPVFPDVNARGKPNGESVDNIEEFLRWAGLTVARDTFAKQTLIEGIPGHSRWDDDGLRIVRIEAQRCGLTVKPDLLYDAVFNLAGRQKAHPVRHYLDKCEAAWDGESRLSAWLVEYAGVEVAGLSPERQAYIAAVGELFLVAAVRRVRQPGCKFDTLLVLEGKQGAGKSSVCRTLVPDPDWFSDCLPLGAEPKVVIEMTTGRWLCEFAELTGISRREVEEVKMFLSRQSDAARAAYAREPSERPRQFIAVGTTNDDKYLVDTTGNRRFLPVTVTGSIDLEGLRRDRDQLWGEASRREKEFGAALSLPEQLWAVAAAEQEERRVVGPIEEALTAALGGIADGRIAAADLRKIVSLREGQGEARHSKQIAETMRRLGWTNGMDSKGTRFWRIGDAWRANSLGYDEISGRVRKVRSGGDSYPDFEGEGDAF